MQPTEIPQGALVWLQLNLWWIILASSFASKFCKLVLKNFFANRADSLGKHILYFIMDILDLLKTSAIAPTVQASDTATTSTFTSTSTTTPHVTGGVPTPATTPTPKTDSLKSIVLLIGLSSVLSAGGQLGCLTSIKPTLQAAFSELRMARLKLLDEVVVHYRTKCRAIAVDCYEAKDRQCPALSMCHLEWDQMLGFMTNIHERIVEGMLETVTGDPQKAKDIREDIDKAMAKIRAYLAPKKKVEPPPVKMPEVQKAPSSQPSAEQKEI
jgi:hypothetical protein